MDEKKQLFFSGRNKSVLLYNLNRDFSGRLGGQMTPEQSNRLEKTLNHYMREVFAIEGAEKPLALLNREVVNTTQADFDNFLRKPKQLPAKPTLKVRAAAPPPTSMGTPIEQVANEPKTVMFQDTARTLDQIQKERAGAQPERPPIPDFRLTEDEDGPSPMELYEMAKKARAAEELAAQANKPKPPPGQMPETTESEPNVVDIIRSDAFLKGESSTPMNSILPPPLETKRKSEFPLTVPPRVAAADLLPPRPFVGTNAQQTLIHEESLLQYREIEQNLFISSADRNWVQDGQITMNRYNFTVTFDPGQVTQGPTLTPSSIKKFKNIVRIELVKFIVPKETLDVIAQRTSYTEGPPLLIGVASNIQNNVLAFPSIVVHVSELDGNNYGTNNTVDRSFGVIHYDAQWSSDPSGSSAIAPTSLSTVTTGYVALIPKFLKCQKVYEPTPLATLQKLSIRLERPDNGQLLSNTSDVLAVNSLLFGSGVTLSSIYRSASGPSEYIFIRTSTYFSRFMWEIGDRIRLATNVTPPGTTSIATAESINTFLQWLNQESGHVIVGIGNTFTLGGPLTSVYDGQNGVGYGNVLIIQNKHTDPSIDGNMTPFNFGDETAMDTAFDTATYSGNTINLNHQVQAVFRIITRELDPTTKIRPDNTF
jgi:hypothetical protein